MADHIVELVQTKIYSIRGQKVMLDADIAEIYGVETKRINEAARLGFKRILVPKTGSNIPNKDIQIITAATLREATKVGLVKSESTGESLTL